MQNTGRGHWLCPVCLSKYVFSGSGIPIEKHKPAKRFQHASGGPIFSLAREKIGEKSVLGYVWCFLPLIIGKSLFFSTVAQIENLRKRLNLTRTMQGLGIASLFFCVVSMFLIYIGLQLLSVYVFGLALILLIASLGVSFREIQISTRSLEIYLGAMEKGKIKK